MYTSGKKTHMSLIQLVPPIIEITMTYELSEDFSVAYKGIGQPPVMERHVNLLFFTYIILPATERN